MKDFYILAIDGKEEIAYYNEMIDSTSYEVFHIRANSFEECTDILKLRTTKRFLINLRIKEIE